ncbi:hypothetical protein J2Z32_004186 [Paenibacillus turicensis]|uniref:Uncharacterized protein n=1 Tax=Paenibacillus turicensis TaxID=160487 RepID=A0ABS4FY56_9BACL|nr:hypothetical protein [Paenibacillus turicensis]MBP1907511.1 hypothetical protein [Paenibacillus turicensis]
MSEQNLSRIKKFGRRRKLSTEQENPSSEFVSTQPEGDSGVSGHYFDEDESSVSDMPSRRELYPSQRLKITRWFFNFLLFIFVVILFMLLWWGISESPWGKVHVGS